MRIVLNKMEYEIKSTEQGYDEMLSFLKQSGFELKVEEGENYWVSGNQKVKSIQKENTLKIIGLQNSLAKSLEEIARQERIR